MVSKMACHGVSLKVEVKAHGVHVPPADAIKSESRGDDCHGQPPEGEAVKHALRERLLKRTLQRGQQQARRRHVAEIPAKTDNDEGREEDDVVGGDEEQRAAEEQEQRAGHEHEGRGEVAHEVAGEEAGEVHRDDVSLDDECGCVDGAAGLCHCDGRGCHEGGHCEEAQAGDARRGEEVDGESDLVPRSCLRGRRRGPSQRRCCMVTAVL